VHRKEWAELLYARVPSLSICGEVPDEFAGERSPFVEHRSYTCIASLRLRRASRRRRRRARGRPREALGVRGASLRPSRGARGIRTASLRTSSDARSTRSDARRVRSDARREPKGAFGSAYHSPTRGRRRVTQTQRCAARSSRRVTQTQRCAARSSRCFMTRPRQVRFTGRREAGKSAKRVNRALNNPIFPPSRLPVLSLFCSECSERFVDAPSVRGLVKRPSMKRGGTKPVAAEHATRGVHGLFAPHLIWAFDSAGSAAQSPRTAGLSVDSDSDVRLGLDSDSDLGLQIPSPSSDFGSRHSVSVFGRQFEKAHVPSKAAPSGFVPSGGKYPRLTAERPIDRACLARFFRARACKPTAPTRTSDSDFRFPISDLGARTSELGPRTSDLGPRISAFRLRVRSPVREVTRAFECSPPVEVEVEVGVGASTRTVHSRRVMATIAYSNSFASHFDGGLEAAEYCAFFMQPCSQLS
jgi:hypothetical protein